MIAMAGDCKKPQSAEVDRIGGQAREDAADDGRLGGGRRQGEGEEEAREAHRMDGASRRGDRGNRWISMEEDNVPPPFDPTSLQGEGPQGGVQQRRAILPLPPYR